MIPYRLNLNNGELTQLAENPGNIQGWMTDQNGKLRVALAIVDGVNTQILYRRNGRAALPSGTNYQFQETVALPPSPPTINGLCPDQHRTGQDRPSS